MLISSLIRHLATQQELHGDLLVCYESGKKNEVYIVGDIHIEEHPETGDYQLVLA